MDTGSLSRKRQDFLPKAPHILQDVPLPPVSRHLPLSIRRFLRRAERRQIRFQKEHRVPAFISCDYPQVYQVLRACQTANLVLGNHFCEWGSGLGVVTCLAAMLEYDACGLEIDPDLVDAAQQLAADHELPVEFHRCSFIPPGGGALMAKDVEFSWMETMEAGQEFGQATPADFDLIFAYPWPDEEAFVGTLFDHFARHGTVLATYQEGEEVRVRRKVE